MSGAARFAQAVRGMSSMRMVLALVAVVGLAACGDSSTGPDPEKVTFAASLGVDLTKMTKLPDGVYIQTLTAGNGTITLKATDTATLDHKGYLADGTLFSTGIISQAPIANFIPGFSEGVVGMKLGEVRRIVIPGDQAYGSSPPAGIPKNAVLVFQVTLISIP
jgi:FKBP-type peptidyl-prolyl cis-trans isomerase